MKYLSILILVFVNAFNDANQNFSIVYFINENRLVLLYYLGNPPAIVSTHLNQDVPFTIITQYKYIPKDSQTSNYLGSSFFQDSENTFELDEYEDIFQLFRSEKSISKYSFYMLKDKNKDNEKLVFYKYGLSLAFKFKNENFSVIHYLKKNKLIDRLAYSFIPNARDRGSFVLGRRNHELTNKNLPKSLKFICEIEPSYVTWGCIMNSVSFLSNDIKAEYKVNSYVMFKMNKNKMIFPIKFMEFILDILKKDNSCLLYSKNNYAKQYIRCKTNFENFEKLTITFKFDNYQISLNMTHFFTCAQSLCESLFKSIVNDNQSKWVFGRNFLSNFIATFDYEDPSVTLINYSEQNKIDISRISDSSNISQKKFYLFIICICVITIIYQFILKEIYRKV